MRGMPLIVVALFIDGLKVMVYFVCFALGATLAAAAPGAGAGAGAAGGCVAGAAVGATGGAFVAGVGAAPGALAGCAAGAAAGAVGGGAAGAAAGTALIPLGIGLGMALSVCISATLGAGFLLLLAFNNLFYFKYAVGGGMAGIIPGLDILPGWTAMTVLCVIKSAKEEGTFDASFIGKLSSSFIARVAVDVVAPEAALAVAVAQKHLNAQQPQEAPAQRVQLRNVDIRPARAANDNRRPILATNDNVPTLYAKQA